MNGKSLDPKNDLIIKIQQLIPAVFSEGKIDIEKLRLLLGEHISPGQEHYALNWAGKAACLQSLQVPERDTLVPQPEESIDFDRAEHVVIEGENLEVIKILQKSYHGRIKMIYIDPPYNTGNDCFVYADNFAETRNEYLHRIGDKDEAGYLNREEAFRPNRREMGQFHSNWLSMMYARLFHARNLLREDGVIFVSIDDNEVHNLRLLMNEIFGERNFLGQIVWQTATNNNSTQIAVEHEYILCFARNIDEQDYWEIPSQKGQRIAEEYKKLLGKYGNQPELIQQELREWLEIQKATGTSLTGVAHYRYVDEKGVYYPGNSANTKPGGYMFDVVHPVTGKISERPAHGYRWPEPTFRDAAARGDVEWGRNESVIPRIKKRLDTATEVLRSYYYEDNRKATAELRRLFDSVKIFDNPKSVNLIKMLCRFVLGQGDLVLDFFAGSGTTAQAILELNAEEGTHHRFICVQLPEKTGEKTEAYRAGFHTIAQITRERIRRVINRLEHTGKSPANPETRPGFRAFRLAPSNFKTWRSDGIETVEDLQQQLELFSSPQKPGAPTVDMLWEIMVRQGYMLHVPVMVIEHAAGTLYAADRNHIVVALTQVNESLIEEVLKIKPVHFVILDTLFNNNDSLKTNVRLQLQEANINFKAI